MKQAHYLLLPPLWIVSMSPVYEEGSWENTLCDVQNIIHTMSTGPKEWASGDRLSTVCVNSSASCRMVPGEDCSARPGTPSCRGASDAFNCTLLAFVLNKVNTAGPCLVSKILFPLEFMNKISGVFCLLKINHILCGWDNVFIFLRYVYRIPDSQNR